MRRFYLAYQKWQAAPAKLSGTHFITLPDISDEAATRVFVEYFSFKKNASLNCIYLHFNPLKMLSASSKNITIR